MKYLKIFKPGTDWAVSISLNRISDKSLLEGINSDKDLIVKSMHGSLIVIPNELKKQLYFKIDGGK